MPDLPSTVSWWLICALALAVTGALVWGVRRATTRAARPGRRAGAVPLHGGYLVATAVIAVVALGLILVAFTMSYAALYEAATWLAHTQLHPINGGDLRFLFPLGIDAVIVYFLAMDLLMEWQGRRHALNRWAAYALSAITIILNVSQGDGSTASYLGHAGPPIVIILIAEGVAAWIRHLAGLAHGQAADRIPAGRWIAHPVSTLKVVRLMLGWGITSYPQALEHEQRRQLAYAMLREQHGRTWRRHTPRHLRWMLDNGYELDTAFELTRAMTSATVAMTATEVQHLATPGGQAPGHALTAPPKAEDEGNAAPYREEAGSQEATPVAPAQEEPAHAAPVTDRASAESAAQVDPAPVALPEQVLDETAPPSPFRPEPVPQTEPEPAPKPTLGALSPEQKRRRVQELLVTHPEMTDAELAEQIGSSPRTARRYRAELGYHRSPVATRGHTPSDDGQRDGRDREPETVPAHP